MHDLRAAPRWSKTTIVVVLVVFGLILVVAILALMAFRSGQESSRQRARNDALLHTKTELAEIQSEVTKQLGGMLERAVGIDADSPGTDATLGPTRALRRFLTGDKHGPFVRDVFRVEETDALVWFRGGYRLLDTAARIGIESEDQSDQVDRLKDEKSVAWEVERKSGAKAALAEWQAIANDFGLATHAREHDGALMADGVVFAVQMLSLAVDALDVDPTALDAGAARPLILRALEIESLNAQRNGLDPEYLRFGLEELRREMDDLLSRLPPADAAMLDWEVDTFRRTREQTRAMIGKGLLMGAVAGIRKKDRLGRFVVPDMVESFEESELFGIVWQVKDRSLVVRFDLLAVERAIQESLAEHEAAFWKQGMRAYLFRRAEDTTLPSGRTPVDDRTLNETPYKLPFRILVDRVGDPAGHGEDFTDVMFWAVILLAAAGLIVGGRVLVRLLTREVRLAQLKADFVSNLSHELKTPITSISLFTEMLEDGKITQPEDQAEAYSVLAQESTRLQKLVHRMIDVARGEARRTPYELIPSDLNRPVLEAAERLQRIVTDPGLDLQLHLHPHPLPMLMDGSSMDDVVTNLLSNAWKYKRGDSAKISVRTARRGRYAELVVSDDGVGIPKSERRKVFEMFYRAEQYLTHPVAGTGLGLALVRSVVAGHKGKVRVEAGPGGVGTTIRLRFPMARRLAAQLLDQFPDSMAEVQQIAGGHGKVESEYAEATDGDTLTEPQVRAGANNPGAQS